MPRPGEVLIRVKAFGLNRSELFTRRGLSPNVKFPRILGIEGVGIVEEERPGAQSQVMVTVVKRFHTSRRTAMTQPIPLDANDRFVIFEQLQRHQHCIDNDASRASAQQYQDLYWPDATFTVHDIRDAEFVGRDGMKQLFDYAHSVFPLHKWRHSVGTFVIDGSGKDATVVWRWVVMWKAEREGVVSTGTYTDHFQKRDGVWKCLERASDVDPNWPAALFQPFVDNEAATFKSS